MDAGSLVPRAMETETETDNKPTEASTDPTESNSVRFETAPPSSAPLRKAAAAMELPTEHSATRPAASAGTSSSQDASTTSSMLLEYTDETIEVLPQGAGDATRQETPRNDSTEAMDLDANPAAIDRSVALESSVEMDVPSPMSKSADAVPPDEQRMATTAITATTATPVGDTVAVEKNTVAAEPATDATATESAPKPSPPTTPATPPTPVTSPTTGRAKGKRPSPWREPRGTQPLPLPAKDIVVDHSQSKADDDHDDEASSDDEARQKRRIERRQNRLYRQIASDFISVHIPLTVTADFGVAIQRNRTKRVAALYEKFPSLQPKKQQAAGGVGSNKRDNNNGNKSGGANGDSMDIDANNKSTDKQKGESTIEAPEKKKLVKLKHVPQPHEYESVLDYLEAKYVQGVVVDDNGPGHNGGGDGDAEGDEDDDGEGQGSVYSETSFMDDTGLQRTVAEQVLGHTTTTKLELMDDDNDFFVNVGDLEVEETELTQNGYDPLEDMKALSKKPRKRKKMVSSETKEKKEASQKKDSKAKTGGKKNGKSLPKSDQQSVDSPKKKKAKTTSNSSSKTESKGKVVQKKSNSTSAKGNENADIQKDVKRKEAIVTSCIKDIEELIKNFTDSEMPRKAKPTKTRVALTVPKDKKPGDSITFANPHMAGQKLKVKIPPSASAGGMFKVTVPKAAVEDDDDMDTKDHNRWSRPFYDKLDDYARAHDDWIDARGKLAKATGDNKFGAFVLKREKFTILAPKFPKDCKTTVDEDYLKKVLRRARQNRQKREQTAARLLEQQKGSAETSKSSPKNSPKRKKNTDTSSDDDSDNDVDVPTKKGKSIVKPAQQQKKEIEGITKTVLLPYVTQGFAEKPFDLQHFY